MAASSPPVPGGGTNSPTSAPQYADLIGRPQKLEITARCMHDDGSGCDHRAGDLEAELRIHAVGMARRRWPPPVANIAAPQRNLLRRPPGQPGLQAQLSIDR